VKCFALLIVKLQAIAKRDKEGCEDLPPAAKSMVLSRDLPCALLMEATNVRFGQQLLMVFLLSCASHVPATACQQSRVE
jgi:hypothetical protein